MEIIKSNNGFPHAWKAGRIELLIRSILEDKVKSQLNVDRVMLINPTWMHESNLINDIKQTSPDFIICYNFVDPAIPKVFDAIETSGIPYLILGNAEQFRLDFWAIVSDIYFRNYQPGDITLYPDARKFICLNRKPHPHRVNLVTQLQPFVNEGFISLGLPGTDAIILDSTFSEDQGILDEYQALGLEETDVSCIIRNDIFSLGDLNYWNRACLCLVTETEFSNYNSNNFFISEKTWKPIIGMRPFFIYGQPKLREYLKNNGFDIFEDIFDYSIVDDNSEYSYMQQNQYAQVAITTIKNLIDPVEYLQQNIDRLQKNKDRFYQYAHEQWVNLYNLDLTKYV